MNPVMLLDEVDKVGADYRGDPAAALLEVLDPAQNHTFRDHYLDIDLDLSDVLFLATANVLDTIPSALLDRMELITMDGYTEDDKVAIARTHLLPRQLERAALDDDEVTVTDAALHKMAADYTREAGVRQLERLLAKVFRKVATRSPTRRGRPGRRRRARPARAARPAPVHSGDGASAPRCPASRPAWRSPASAATCCSSRRHALADGETPASTLDRPARRRDEGVGADRAVLRALARRRARHRRRRRWTGRSTCTCRPARCRRTGRPPA